MKKRVFEFTCPNCGSSFFMARDTYLIKDAKSLEYSRLKDHTYFRHQCQNRKVLFDLDYPLIYRDGKRRFSLVLAQSLPQGMEGQVILTKSPAQFLDAFSILDLGLDPRRVLPILIALRKQHGENTYLFDFDAKNHLIWFQSPEGPLTVGYF